MATAQVWQQLTDRTGPAEPWIVEWDSSPRKRAVIRTTVAASCYEQAVDAALKWQSVHRSGDVRQLSLGSIYPKR